MKNASLVKWTFAVLGAVTLSTAGAAPPVKKPSPRPAKLASPAPIAPNPQASPAKSKVLWDSWYTVTAERGLHYGYYNDRVEMKEGKVIFQNRFWKAEEGYINEESLGAFAADNEELTPLFFNFRSSYRGTETKIDGTLKDGRALQVRVTKGGIDLPIVKKTIPPKVIFSVLFPVWLGRKLASMKETQTYSFFTLMEDNLALNFHPVNGNARLDKPDDYASKTKTQKVTVTNNDIQSTWYVMPSGFPVRIEMSGQKIVIQKAPAEIAQKFLDDAP